MSTVLDPRDTILRLRRRPAKIVINIRTSRVIFGEESVKVLNIFAFINIYNYYINGINNAN